ncbi:hypothetical protein O181_112170 [Austropuccinia psidii MF-1]|uniref:Uncharacterized protein n=1 Tax=Austropuccinia psidii MF-1 TaxID=1389203 RepID=A0A9Q3K3W7_9BASI|nr:hypothetical protein [Austropuccinia psidii MF-1]
MAKSLKTYFLPSEAFQNPNFIHILLTSTQKTFGPFQASITKSAIYGVIHYYASFCSSNQKAEISNGYFSFSTGYQGTPSRELIKAEGQASQFQIPMTPSGNQWLFSLTVSVQGNTGCSISRDIQEAVSKQCVKGQCSTNPPWQPNPFSTVLIHQDLYFSFIHHGKIIQPSLFPNLARYTLHQTINTPSSIKYRTTASLKESSCQRFTYTSLL